MDMFHKADETVKNEKVINSAPVKRVRLKDPQLEGFSPTVSTKNFLRIINFNPKTGVWMAGPLKARNTVPKSPEGIWNDPGHGEIIGNKVVIQAWEVGTSKSNFKDEHGKVQDRHWIQGYLVNPMLSDQSEPPVLQRAVMFYGEKANILRVFDRVAGINRQGKLNAEHEAVNYQVTLSSNPVEGNSPEYAFEILAIAWDIHRDNNLPHWYEILRYAYLANKANDRKNRPYVKIS